MGILEYQHIVAYMKYEQTEDLEFKSNEYLPKLLKDISLAPETKLLNFLIYIILNSRLLFILCADFEVSLRKTPGKIVIDACS